MAVFAWVMMGLAVWHFSIFLPDRFWAGIVGAFLGAVLGAIVVGLLLHGLDVPSRDDTTVLTALEGIPGAIAGMAVIWFIGVRSGVDGQHAFTNPHGQGKDLKKA